MGRGPSGVRWCARVGCGSRMSWDKKTCILKVHFDSLWYDEIAGIQSVFRIYTPFRRQSIRRSTEVTYTQVSLSYRV